MSAAPAMAQSVEVAGGDWSAIPRLESNGQHILSTDTMDRIEALAEKGVCRTPRLDRHRIELTVPFLLHFDSAGSLQKVVVARLGCEPLESLMATAALHLARMGDYKPTGENAAGWYRSELSFSLK